MATSSEYWRKREQENLRKNLKSEAEYAKEIQQTYKFAMDQIQREIDSFYAKYAKDEGITIAQAKKRASKLDMEEYSRKAKKYVREKNFSKQANEEMKLYNLTMKVNRLELLKASIGLELVSAFDELQRFYEQILTDRTLDEFKRQAGILGSSVPDNATVLAATIVNASFHNAKYSERIWMHQDLLRNELGKLLTRGMVQGKNPRVLARELRKTFDVSIYNSERLMQTELARVQTEAQLQSYKENGFEEYEYMACHNRDVCANCKALDGKVFKIDDGMPGENAPPMHPSCHCATAAYMDLNAYEKWLDGYSKHGLSFNEWQERSSKKKSSRKGQDVTRKYLKDAKPRQGAMSYGDGYKRSNHSDEIRVAEWIHSNLGGDITLLAEKKDCSTKMPDYLWKDRYWELKNTTTEKAADSAIRSALKQIKDKPGGIILDYGANGFDPERLRDVINRRIMRSSGFDVDILIMSADKLFKVYRYKK